MRLLILALLLVMLRALPGSAHPHVFIDAGLRLLFDDQGRLAAVRVVWVYDAYFSLLLAAEKGLAPDAAGNIPAAELEPLRGKDVLWDDPEFHGDLYLRAAGQAVPLGPPQQHTAAFAEGRYVTSHLRPLTRRVDPLAEPVLMQVYDASYYAHYETGLALDVEGRAGCALTREPPDLDLAASQLSIPLSELEGARDIAAQIDDLGALFADKLRLTCAAPS